MEKIRIGYDYKQFNEYARRMLILGIIYSVISIAGLVVLLIGFNPNLLWTRYIVFDMITIWLFLFFSSTAIPLFYRYIKEKKNYKKYLNYETDCFFENLYINCISYDKEEEKGTVKIFYKNLRHYRLTKNYVLLYQTKVDCIMLPKSEELIQFIDSKGIKKKF